MLNFHGHDNAKLNRKFRLISPACSSELGAGDIFYMIMVMADDPNLLEQTGIRSVVKPTTTTATERSSKANVTERGSGHASSTSSPRRQPSASRRHVMNISAIGNRTHPRDIRKALGATIGDIMFQFMTESVILTCHGASAYRSGRFDDG